MKNIEMLLNDILNMGNLGKYGKSMQTRKIKKGLFSNVHSFTEQAQRMRHTFLSRGRFQLILYTNYLQV